MRDLHESSAPTITFRQAREEGACPGSYRRMARHVGGITRFGRDTPLPIATVLDVLGLEDALWALDAAGYRRVLRLWACDCAERAVQIFERARPGDRRPREAVRVSRLHARAAEPEDVSWETAWDAARDASFVASWSTSLDGALADERAWQTERLRAYLEGRA